MANTEKYGIAVDVGTTNIEGALCEIESGKIIASRVMRNPQIAFGADVVSRLDFCETYGSSLLHESLICEIDRMAAELCEKIGGLNPDIPIVLAGNTVMEHFSADLDAVPLGKAPFTPASLLGQEYSGSELGFDSFAGNKIYISPCIAAYLGGDIAAGLLCMPDKKGNSLFIDLGTNAEIVLVANSRIVAASAAAGPALEGCGLSCGIPAALGGAVQRATLENDRVVLKTADGKEPAGICGSGMKDLFAILTKLGIITESGAINTEITHPAFSVGKREIAITGTALSVSELDIRKIQLAKAAVCAAIIMLVRTAGITVDALDNIYLSGGFGMAADTESIIQIGLLPREFSGKVTMLGNTSLLGAAKLLDKKSRVVCETIAKAVEVITLSGNSEWNDLFVDKMDF